MKLHFLLDILHLIFPKTCLSCKSVLLRKERIICIKCYLNLPKYIDRKNKHTKEVIVDGEIYQVYSKYKYQKKSIIQNLIFDLKYNNRKDIGIFLGQELYKYISDFKPIDTAIVPVPLNARKQQLRGYNQCELIAKGLAQGLNCSILTNVLKRIENNASQTLKSRYKRFQNVEGVFQLNGQEQLNVKHIILLDDVFTSGATISECIRALSKLNNIKISVVCVAS